jgi:endonuclease/exonuclease/phosphatase family metal-dependent hydrolase
MRKTLTILILLLLFLPETNGQVLFRVMSYNVENLFDTEDDPATDDNEFLPSAGRRWNNKRYYHKLQQLSKVIAAAGEWDTPALIGLCEVENDTVVTHLLRRTPLYTQHYQYCISNRSDKRGINVALLYQRDKFRYLAHHSIPVRHRKKNIRTARDILHVSGEVISGDTLDVIICHFPSKYGGEKESEGRRMDAATALRGLCDSLMRVRSHPLIIAMGDFNDPPGSRCMKFVTENNLRNLFADKNGSHKYHGEWSQLDQIIIHPSMLSPEAGMKLIPGSVRNFSPSFLLTKDKTWLGVRPRRTYYGYKHEAGYSDHLPVLADFLLSLP